MSSSFCSDRSGEPSSAMVLPTSSWTICFKSESAPWTAGVHQQYRVLWRASCDDHHPPLHCCGVVPRTPRRLQTVAHIAGQAVARSAQRCNVLRDELLPLCLRIMARRFPAAEEPCHGDKPPPMSYFLPRLVTTGPLVPSVKRGHRKT